MHAVRGACRSCGQPFSFGAVALVPMQSSAAAPPIAPARELPLPLARLPQPGGVTLATDASGMTISFRSDGDVRCD